MVSVNSTANLCVSIVLMGCFFAAPCTASDDVLGSGTPQFTLESQKSKIAELAQCRLSKEHVLSVLSVAISHTNGLISKDPSPEIENGVLDRLFTAYKQAGGLESVATNILKLPDPCNGLVGELREYSHNELSKLKALGVKQKKAIIDFNTCSPPDYPRISLRVEEQGTVRIKFLVDVTGTIITSFYESSSGSPFLDEYALSALNKCGFQPGSNDGVPAITWTTIDYVWKLPD